MTDFLIDLNDAFHREMEMAAIWFEKKIKTRTETTFRIEPGHFVTVENGKLVDCEGEPTHKVIGCTGNAINTSLNLILWDLQKQQPFTLKIK